MWTEQLTVSSA